MKKNVLAVLLICIVFAICTMPALAQDRDPYLLILPNYDDDVYDAMVSKAGDNPTLSFTSVNEAKRGDNVSVTLEFTNNPSVTGLQFTPTFDETRLQFTGIEFNRRTSVFNGCTKATESDKVVCYAMPDTGEEDGEIVTLNFKVLDNAPAGAASVSIIVNYGDLRNYDNEVITPDITPGSVTVVAPSVKPTSVEVNPKTVNIEVGQSADLTVTVLPAEADDKSVTWGSSNASVASVTDGKVTGVSAGTATITVRSNADPTVFDTCAVTVTSPVITPVLPTSITLIPRGTSLMPGQTLKVGLEVKPEEAEDKTVKWSSSDPSVASVDQNGVVTANSAGEATITATSNADPSVYGTMTMTVLGPAPVLPTSITLSPAVGEISVNGTLQVTAAVKPDNASDKTVKWSSSNTSVAVVNPNGVVTGISAGQATITATSNADPSVSGRMTVTVLAPAPVLPLSITLNPPHGEIPVNGTLQVIAIVKPDNATDKTVAWSSSDTTIAVVNSHGVVTGVSEGIVTITATSNADPAVSAQMRVTVTGNINPPNPPRPTPFNRLDDVVLPRTGFSALRPQVIAEKPLNISYKPVSLMLEIPSLSLSADIAEVPFVDGEYPITWLGESVGLLEGFALPGEGYTVLTGHNHLNNTEAGPFALLSSLEEGDRIFVRDAHDDLKIYVVYANEKVAEADSSAVENIAVKYDGSLTMITCEDERIEGGYANRRIVAAKPN